MIEMVENYLKTWGTQKKASRKQKKTIKQKSNNKKSNSQGVLLKHPLLSEESGTYVFLFSRVFFVF